MTKAVLRHTGKVLWTPPAIFKSSCEIDVRYFPFDQQTCFMKFGSWTYDGNQIDLKHINQKIGEDKVEVGIDLREYYPSVEWDILGVPAERHEKYYPCCAEPYPGRYCNLIACYFTTFHCCFRYFLQYHFTPQNSVLHSKSHSTLCRNFLSISSSILPTS